MSLFGVDRRWRADEPEPEVAGEAVFPRPSLVVVPPPRPRFRLGQIGLILAVVVGGLAWVASGPPFASVAPPVEISALEAGTAGRQLAVSATVASHDRRPRTVRIWWILASRGPGNDWDRRAYQSSVRTESLPGGSKVRFTWSESVPVPAGTYSLSAWLHLEGPGGFSHASGEHFGEVDLATTGPLLRHRPPQSGATIADATAAFNTGTFETATFDTGTFNTGDPGELTVTVTLDNAGPDTIRGRLEWRLLEVEGQPDPSWWQGPPVARSPELAVAVPPMSRQTFIVAGMPAAPPGNYLVHVVLNPVTSAAEEPLDDVAVVGVSRPAGGDGGATRIAVGRR